MADRTDPLRPWIVMLLVPFALAACCFATAIAVDGRTAAGLAFAPLVFLPPVSVGILAWLALRTDLNAAPATVVEIPLPAGEEELRSAA